VCVPDDENGVHEEGQSRNDWEVD